MNTKLTNEIKATLQRVKNTYISTNDTMTVTYSMSNQYYYVLTMFSLNDPSSTYTDRSGIYFISTTGSDYAVNPVKASTAITSFTKGSSTLKINISGASNCSISLFRYT